MTGGGEQREFEGQLRIAKHPFVILQTVSPRHLLLGIFRHTTEIDTENRYLMFK